MTPTRSLPRTGAICAGADVIDETPGHAYYDLESVIEAQTDLVARLTGLMYVEG